MPNKEKTPSLQLQLTRAIGENSVYLPGKHILDPKVRTAYLVDLKDDFQNNRIYSLQIHYALHELAKLMEFSDETEKLQESLTDCVVMSPNFREYYGEEYRFRLYEYFKLLLKIHQQADGVMAALQLFGHGGDDTELFVRLGE